MSHADWFMETNVAVFLRVFHGASGFSSPYLTAGRVTSFRLIACGNVIRSRVVKIQIISKEIYLGLRTICTIIKRRYCIRDTQHLGNYEYSPPVNA